MSSSVERFQIPLETAEAYEAKFVPALFGEWAPHLVDAAGVMAQQSVLDVACGTGVVAREAAERVGERGRVVGVDLNPAMLEVARRLRPDLEWRQGDAAALPFENGAFDVVLCQSALMFFPDPAQAVREMARVVRSGGTVGLQVWGRLESQPGYRPLVQAAERHAGTEAVQLLSTYWALGDPKMLHGLLESAELRLTAIRTRMGTARFDSLDAMVRTEVDSTPLGERISEDTYQLILEDSRKALARYRTEGGKADIPIQGHLAIARKE